MNLRGARLFNCCINDQTKLDGIDIDYATLTNFLNDAKNYQDEVMQNENAINNEWTFFILFFILLKNASSSDLNKLKEYFKNNSDEKLESYRQIFDSYWSFRRVFAITRLLKLKECISTKEILQWFLNEKNNRYFLLIKCLNQQIKASNDKYIKIENPSWVNRLHKWWMGSTQKSKWKKHVLSFWRTIQRLSLAVFITCGTMTTLSFIFLGPSLPSFILMGLALGCLIPFLDSSLIRAAAFLLLNVGYKLILNALILNTITQALLIASSLMVTVSLLARNLCEIKNLSHKNLEVQKNSQTNSFARLFITDFHKHY